MPYIVKRSLRRAVSDHKVVYGSFHLYKYKKTCRGSLMKSFKGHLIEMAQQGFQYEINAARVLKNYGIVPSSFTPAGAGSDIPDLMIQRNGVKAGCELKITAASAGSLVMKYDQGKWFIGNREETDDEKIFVQRLADEVGILDQIQREWNNEPYKFTRDPKLKKEIEGLDKRGIYAAELKRFPEIKGNIPATKIEEYYNKKKTYYVNVGYSWILSLRF